MLKAKELKKHAVNLPLRTKLWLQAELKQKKKFNWLFLKVHVKENHSSVPVSEIQCQKLLVGTICLPAPESSLLTGVDNEVKTSESNVT